jgi:F-type H+-transporting ATPase subunit epsilon
MTATILSDKTFLFELVSPERILVSEDAVMVTIPGELGELGILADHAPLLTSLRPGIVTVYLPGGAEKRIFVAGGFADVNDNACTVLAEEAMKAVDIVRADVEKKLRELHEDIGFAKDDTQKIMHINEQIEIEQAKLQLAS